LQLRQLPLHFSAEGLFNLNGQQLSAVRTNSPALLMKSFEKAFSKYTEYSVSGNINLHNLHNHSIAEHTVTILNILLIGRRLDDNSTTICFEINPCPKDFYYA